MGKLETPVIIGILGDQEVGKQLSPTRLLIILTNTIVL